MEPRNMIWTEKFRPKKISEMIGDFKQKVLKYLEKPDEIPHFLFYSKTPGTGKTTLAKAIINELDCDYIVINSSDDRKLEVIRNKVKQFAITKSSKSGLRRCVFLDEIDGMWGPAKASQEALRNVMETYAKNVFFILTCNNINKVIEPLKSRCKVIPFAYPNRDEIHKYLTFICEQEGMQYTSEGITKLIDMTYPSIRNCVVALQDLKVEGKEVTPETVQPVNVIFDEMWECLKKKDWQSIKTIVLQSTVDPRELNTYFWERFLADENIKGIQITCRNEKDISWGAESRIIFVTSLIEMLK